MCKNVPGYKYTNIKIMKGFDIETVCFDIKSF